MVCEAAYLNITIENSREHGTEEDIKKR